MYQKQKTERVNRLQMNPKPLQDPAQILWHATLKVNALIRPRMANADMIGMEKVTAKLEWIAPVGCVEKISHDRISSGL